jgi:hypothetical protein
MNIENWLPQLGLEQYAPVFRENDIDGELLESLTADDLKELGIKSIGHRRKLLDAIAALRVERSPSERSLAGDTSAMTYTMFMWCLVAEEGEPLPAKPKPEAGHRATTWASG